MTARAQHDYLKIAGGTVYDPANGIDGAVRDLWISGGKIVAAPTDPAVRPARTLDARGLVVMPGGIDMHCHIAGPKVNLARRMRPEDRRAADPMPRLSNFRSGTLGSTPSTFATGYRYAALGYTTAFDAAVPPLGARHAHEELADTPCLDGGFFVLMGNHHFLLDALRTREPAKLRDFVGWLLQATRGYAPKLVNPGGIEMWKQHQAGNAGELDEPIDHFNVSPRQIIAAVAQAAAELELPHPVHIHANHLGIPGNWQTTLETMRALEGRRGHLTHIQFHSYGGSPNDVGSLSSQVAALVEYFQSQPQLTVDVGQVLFGPTTSMTGDGPLGYFLHKIYGGKWQSDDVELESGCGIVPIEYKEKSLIHAWQWAIGLEWYLLVDDPWRIAMSTDHPNGGSFLAYPEMVRLLMDRDARRDVLQRIHPQVREQSQLKDLDREYSLGEICTISRAAPARMLGLVNKGHLGPGADADITIYDQDDDPARMFEWPRWVIKAGAVIVENGELRDAMPGGRLHVSPEFDPAIERELARWWSEHSTLEFANFAVGDEYLPAIAGADDPG